MKVTISAMMLATIATADTLRTLGNRVGVLMGSAVNMYQLEGDSRYEAYSTQHNSVVTAEYECKMNIIRPNENTWNLGRCVLAAQYAHDNGMEFRGHSLVWGATSKVPNIVPGWLKNGNHSNWRLD